MEIKIRSPKYGEQVILIDDEDYEKIKDYNLYLWTTPRHHSIYLLGNLRGTRGSVRMHRVIMQVTDLKLVVDHINGNALDNRKCNLRVTTQANNNRNARKRKSARTSKYKGVHFCSRTKRWIAQIQINKKKHGSIHQTELEAAEGYNLLAIKFHGEFAVLNKLEK